MNGGLLPMLGVPVPHRTAENAGVNSPLAPIPASTLPRLRSRRRSQHAGFTLIEVMVALIVLVLGVLGAAAMTLNALRDNKQSALRSQATALAYELGEMMRMNTGGATAQAVFVGGTPTASASCYGSGCSLLVLASNDFAEWQAKVNAALPGAVIKVCRDQTNLNSISTCDSNANAPVVVKLQWFEKNNNGSSGALQATANSDQPSLVVTLRNY